MEDQRRGPYLVSHDPDLIDVDVVHRFLAEDSYWAKGIARETVAKSISTCLCFGLYHDEAGMVGFSRVLTDTVTHAYIDDVFVLSGHRGRGLGDWLIATTLAHPDVADVRMTMLLTADAHALYARHGFQVFPAPQYVMTRG